MRGHLRCRPAMTLVEVIIVLAIIAVLVALLLTALAKVRNKADDLANYNDLVGLNTAITAFITDPRLQAGFIPSRLDPSGSDPGSADYLRKLFPASGGKLKLASVMLQGDEVIVFILAGPGGKGWSTDPIDPTTQRGDRLVFHKFPPDRLIDPDGNGYPSYIDIFGTPIVYFSSRHWNGAGWTENDYQDDCPRLGVQPYTSADRVSWQLVSAGRNQRFGMGGMAWTALMATTIYPPGSDGHDDFANFAPGFRLGAKP